MPDRTPDALELELIELGRALAIAPPRDDLADLVLARIADESITQDADSPVQHGVSPTSKVAGWLETRRRRFAATLAAAALLVVAFVPPVRAAVLEFFRIGGVAVREVPVPSTPLSPASSATGGGATSVPGHPADAVVVGSVEEAEGRVGIDVAVPAALGAPTKIAVSHAGRVIELTWGAGAGTTRLDVFDGTLSWGYLKSVWNQLTPTGVGGYQAAWFGSTHLIEWVDRAHATHTDPPRQAGPTLVWVVPRAGGDLTYRLEGPTTLDSARAIAESVP